MNIILDTNIIMSNFLMDTSEFDVLFDYLKKTNSNIIIPEVVYKEVLANYERSLGKRFDELGGCIVRINLMLSSAPVKIDAINIKKNLEKYTEYFGKKIGLSRHNQVIPLDSAHFASVVERAIGHRKPCSPGGRGFRDSLIWLATLDAAKKQMRK